MTELTAFQRDCLRGIAVLNKTHGLGLKEWLESETEHGKGGSVHHGRLYPNLGKLVTMGLVNKSERDKRTNEYRLSTRGQTEVEYYADEWTAAVSAINDE